MLVNVTLTKKQAEALLWAIDLTNASYQGWTKEDMGNETNNDLRTLNRAEERLSFVLYGNEK
jgi:hypothetical protein